MEEVLKLIMVEIALQEHKWGADRILPNALWITILGEEFGEVCKAALEQEQEEYIAELVDVAASAISAIRSALLEKQTD